MPRGDPVHTPRSAGAQSRSRAWKHADLNWSWLVSEAKQHDLQNRLGFVVTLARVLANRHHDTDAAATLTAVEVQLERARLVREDTLGRGSMTSAERRWLRRQRPPSARHWNLLTSLVPEHLSYGS